jgi:tetratricopeptide (TPR) repeat protein
MLDTLTAIQNNGRLATPEKIEQLARLREVFLKCRPVKDSVYARIVHRLGDLYSKANDLEKAISFTREAVAVNSVKNKQAEPSFLANSYLNLGIFYNSLYLPGESVNYFDSCILVSSQYPEKYFIAFRAFEANAYSFFHKGDYQKSRETAENGILFAEKINDSLNEAPLLAQKAQAEIALKQIASAERNITRSIFLLENNNTDSIRLATSYSIYASLLNQKGFLNSAISYYQKAFELNKAKAYWRQCAKDMLDLGYLYDAGLQNDIKALACYNQA